jgi:hypothetical protein
MQEGPNALHDGTLIERIQQSTFRQSPSFKLDLIWSILA